MGIEHLEIIYIAFEYSEENNLFGTLNLEQLDHIFNTLKIYILEGLKNSEMCGYSSHVVKIMFKVYFKGDIKLKVISS